MIAVDTSIWIAARRHPPIGRALDSLIDADEVALPLPVRLELWAGLPKRERKAFARAIGGLIQLVPTEDTWKVLPEWIERAADAGEHFSLSDLMIASLTAEVGGLVWSLDEDFERMERLKFVGRYDPTLSNDP